MLVAGTAAAGLRHAFLLLRGSSSSSSSSNSKGIIIRRGIRYATRSSNNSNTNNKGCEARTRSSACNGRVHDASPFARFNSSAQHSRAQSTTEITATTATTATAVQAQRALTAARSFQFSHITARPNSVLCHPASTGSPLSIAAGIMSSTTFQIEGAKTGRSGCKECKQKIDKDVLRIGKVTPSAFSDDATMTSWFHVPCFFKAQMRSRATTTKLEDPADLEGFYSLSEDDRRSVKKAIDDFVTAYAEQQAKKKTKTKTKAAAAGKKAAPSAAAGPVSPITGSPKKTAQATLSFRGGTMGLRKDTTGATATSTTTSRPAAGAARDLSSSSATTFANFCDLCNRIAARPSYNDKTDAVRQYITKGNSAGDGFKGDLYLVIRLLLPRNPKRVYNMKDKAFVRVFSNLLGCDAAAMTADLDKGDCPETCATFFAKNKRIPPKEKSTLTLAEVENFLRRMEGLTTIDAQTAEFRKLLPKCTVNDVRFILRSMKHDLRTFAGPKHILSALHPRAYEAWQASHSLKALINRIQATKKGGKLSKDLSVRASLMTAVKPMLAEACRTYERAFSKCPNGIYAEIKYDGERVQVHKRGDRFEFFSRSLKPVSDHKITFFKDSVKQACPHGDTMILDAEVLMVDTSTGKPLPFGTLGIHKKKAFKTARPCLFIFDILHFNGQSLMNKTLRERREFLESNVVEVEHEIMYSEKYHIKSQEELAGLMKRVMSEGLEGLVLKDRHSTYQPGKRRWLKVKKDYLQAGALADTADLVVLGAYYGTGTKGGIMSVFLMGCQDSKGKWRTVCKVGNGHTDAALEKINRELDVIKISKDPSKVPSWLVINKSDLVPDFIVPDPKKAPVWEITGAEFSESTSHSADNISIRFPRVTKVRDDKDWQTATSLKELKKLYDTSKERTDIAPAPSFMKKDKTARRGDGEEADDDGEPASKTAKISAAGKGSTTTKKKPATTATTAAAAAMAARGTRKRKTTKKTGRKDALAFDQDDDYEYDGFVVPDDDGDGDDDEYVVDDDDIDEIDSEEMDEDEDDEGRVPARTHARGERKRDKCRYGASCYQKNPAHKARFAHPGDKDWRDSDDEEVDEGSDAGGDAATDVDDGATAATAAAAAAGGGGGGGDDGDSGKAAGVAGRGGAKNKNGDATTADDGPLKNVFHGVTCFISDAVPDYSKAYRYGTAFGAELVNAMGGDVTHVVVPDLDVDKWDAATKSAVSMASSTGARVVTAKWLWDSIKRRTRQPERSYAL
ncbi:ligase III [Salpingoeca rosetta]|uniref:DNA ligase n=1 Tax=Salpingoeca rosetta (strain ATCC 50818 / BSB-021) TaxID=946362 RepID=F2US92_SALR5|nr:ligase III [Salpingoeca rosetta]EGD81001.1 ligase III [Salpingoeca rosetta]|eukprot:XP_004987871.1 ligase III [Salpingoeca rosetta]